MLPKGLNRLPPQWAFGRAKAAGKDSGFSGYSRNPRRKLKRRYPVLSHPTLDGKEPHHRSPGVICYSRRLGNGYRLEVRK